MANTVLHKRSSVVENGQPKLPTSEQMKHGEIAINFASDLERISLKNADNEIVTFIPEHEIDKRIADVVASTSNLEIKKDENATHITLNVETVDGVAVYTIGESDIASASEVAENEEVTAQALTQLNDRLDVLEGEGDGSVAKAIDDAIAQEVTDRNAAIGEAKSELEGKIQDAVDGAKSYEIAKLTAEEITALSDANVLEAYKLIETGQTAAEGQIIKIYKDSALQDVELVVEDGEGNKGQFLKFTYDTVSGNTRIVYLNVSTFLHESEFSDGLQVSEAGVVSVKVDATSESFLTVGADGIKLAGVQDAIDAAIAQEVTDRNTAIQNASDEINAEISQNEEATAQALTRLNDRVGALEGSMGEGSVADQITAAVDALANGAVADNTAAIEVLNGDGEGSVAKAVADAKGIIDAYTVNGKAISTNPVLGAADIQYAESVTVADAITALEAEVSENEEVSAQALTRLNDRVNVLESSVGETPVTDQIADAISQEVSDRNTAIQNAADEINAEISQNEETTAQALTKLNDRVSTLEGSVGEGSVADQITDAVDALANGPVADNADAITGINNTIAAMDATVESTDGTHVAVKVSEVDGVITAVNVTETDIASAQALSDLEAEVSENEEVTAQALTRLNDRVNVLESSVGETPVTDQIADAVSQEVTDRNTAIQNAKNDLLGDAGADYNTLGKLEDKIQAVETAAKSYTIVAVTGQGENVREAYQLQQTMNGATTNVGEIIKIYKDSSLKSVALDGQTLNFTYILADGTESTVGVDVSAFLAESEFGNGLQVVDHVVSVKVDATSESYLTVGADGIKLSGIQEIADEVTENAKVAAAALTDLDSRVLAFESGDNSVANQIANAIGGLDVSDSAVAGQYVSAVSEVDGKITVSRATLPDVDAAIKAYVGEIPAGIEETNIIEIIENNELTTASALTELKTTKADSSAVANAIALANYMQGVNNVTSIASLPISKRLVVCTLSANGTLSMSSTPSAGNEVHVMVNNTSAADITVTIPTASPYVDFTGGTVTVPASGWAEINIISDGTNLYVRAI